MSKKKLFAGKLGKSTFTFILGAMLMVSVSAAVAQTQNPPAGDINATFDSVTTDDIRVNRGLILGDPTNVDAWESDGDSSYITVRSLFIRSILMSQYVLNFYDYLNLGLIYTMNLHSAGEITTDSNIAAKGSVTASSVGSFFKVKVTKQAKNYPQSGSSRRQHVDATCPINTFLVSCGGGMWDSMDFLEYMGGEKTSHSRTCRSFARAKSGSRDTSRWVNDSVTHAVEAYCFDPTGQQTSDIFERIDIPADGGIGPTQVEVTTVDPNDFLRRIELNVDLSDLEVLCSDPSDCGPNLGTGGLDPWINPGL